MLYFKKKVEIFLIIWSQGIICLTTIIHYEPNKVIKVKSKEKDDCLDVIQVVVLKQETLINFSKGF